MGFFQQTQFITPVLSSTVKKQKRELQSKKVGSVVPRGDDTQISREIAAMDISFQTV